MELNNLEWILSLHIIYFSKKFNKWFSDILPFHIRVFVHISVALLIRVQDYMLYICILRHALSILHKNEERRWEITTTEWAQSRFSSELHLKPKYIFFEFMEIMTNLLY